jgi:DNA-directed RNA polymerase specialized sigma24 family protein
LGPAPGRADGEPDASDVVQETLLETWQKIDAFHGTTEADFRAWLRTTLVHNEVDDHRKRGAAKRG